MKKLLIFLLLLLLLKQTFSQSKEYNAYASAAKPSGFLKNVGQVRDFNNKPVDFVYYQGKIGSQQVYITNYGLSVLLTIPKKITRIAPPQSEKEKAAQKLTASDSLISVDYEMERIDIVLKNATIDPEKISAQGNKHAPHYNFYLGEQTGSNHELLLNDELLVKDVYPGIDWKLYIKEDVARQPFLKYDFIVHPGADPSLIKLRYSNNAQMKLFDGFINAKVKMGLLKEEKPYSYTDDNREVQVNYRLNQNTISFNAKNYDKSKTLIIDPSIFWMTYLSATDQVYRYESIYGNDIETDEAGNIFVQLSAAGNTPFPTLNPGGGAYFQNYTASPNGSMVICKFAPGGQLLWSTFFGNWVAGRLMTIDKYGNIIALGMVRYSTPDFPNPNPSIPVKDNGGFYKPLASKYFLAKFTNEGVLQWSSYYLSGLGYPTDMSYDVNGNFYVVGWAEKPFFPYVDPGGGAYMFDSNTTGATQLLFISQFDAKNNLSWSTRLQGNAYDPYARVTTDKLGNIYVGGQVRSNNFPLVNAGGYYNDSGNGSVLARFNTSRQLTWGTYFPGSFTFADLTTDDSANLYVIADRRILKFNNKTELVFEKSVQTKQMHFWKKANFDPVMDQLQLYGVMNDGFWGFPTLNTSCNGSFYKSSTEPFKIINLMGPIFATMTRNGEFTYRSLADWGYEYYDESEMTVDVNGNALYLFGSNHGGFLRPNPQLTDPGNGAYFDTNCCYLSGANSSALILKLNPSELDASVEFTAPQSCDCNGEAKVTVKCGTAPFTYTWSNGDSTDSVSGLCAGNYTVKVSDANHLSKVLYFSIPNPPGSISSISQTIIPENCTLANGKIIIESVQGGVAPYTYAIDKGSYQLSSQFSNLDSGSYIIHVKDANGCKFSDTLQVSRVTGPSSFTYKTDVSSCLGNDGTLKVNSVTGGVAPYEYSLSGIGVNHAGIFTQLAPMQYQLVITDSAGCHISDHITIDRALPPTDIIAVSGNDHCNKGVGFLKLKSVIGGIKPYKVSVDSLNFHNEVVANLKGGSYQLCVKDSNGCVLKKGPFIIDNVAGPESTDLLIEPAYCGQLTGSVGITSVQGGIKPYTYSIDDNGYGLSNKFLKIEPGQHQLNVKDSFGCIYSKPIEIDFKPVAKIELFPGDTTICYDQILSLQLKGDIELVKEINWNIAAEGITANYKAIDDKKIIVQVIDGNQCIIRDTSIVSIKACNPPEKCLVIPTAFTPNRDGKNETVGPRTNGCRVKSISFQIYNRWGEIVYKTNDLGRWDGIYQGREQPAGTYVFICNYITEDGVNRQQKGTILLIR